MVSKPSLPRWRRRLFCTEAADGHHDDHLRNRQWSIKQVTKSNFAGSLEEIKNHISGSDFVAVSLKKTGSFSSAWHRVSPFDTLDTAYLKAKFAAERFQILQFAVCPFSFTASKVVAHPYNFHLFPRDELRIGMPSYSFSCQASYLTAMAREGFDFNSCIYDGISYLSKAQESAAKYRLGIPVAIYDVTKSSSTPTIADTVFVERIKSRVKHWKDACKSLHTQSDEILINSLRRLVLGSDQYGSRPCMAIDVCSERQVQLVLEMLGKFSDDLVPLIIPAKGGGTQAIRVVLTSSTEDKDLFERELQNVQEEQSRKVRGFREVIDLISASQKPLVSYNSLNDFTFIHSKFLGPLPPDIDEFMHSLRLVFPHVLDVNHLMKEIGPLRKMTSIPAATTYLKTRFFLPMDMEISHQAMSTEGKSHGYNSIRICQLFAKLCSLMKITSSIQSNNETLASAVKEYANIFNSRATSPREPDSGDIQVWTTIDRRVSCENLVFLWGFSDRTSAGQLKSMLQGCHEIFSEEFDVRFVDRSCAIVVFWQPDRSKAFLNALNSKEISGSLRDMVSEGLGAASYETYKRACRLGLWEADLADSLDKALEGHLSPLGGDAKTKSSDVFWCSESIIDLDDL